VSRRLRYATAKAERTRHKCPLLALGRDPEGGFRPSLAVCHRNNAQLIVIVPHVIGKMQTPQNCEHKGVRA
jgi:hypothetical protein